MKLLIVLISTACTLSIFSQATYTVSNYGSAGYGFRESTVLTGLASFDFTLTGASQTWNYAGLVSESNELNEVINPNNTDYRFPWIAQCTFNGGNPFSCNNDWNDLTDIARLIIDSLNTPILSIYEVTSLLAVDGGNVIANIQGAKVADSSNTVVPLTSDFIDRDTVYSFPLNFGNTHTSHGKWGVDLNSIGRNIKVVIDYDRNYTVDGWGTLITPYRVHNNVLKMRTQIDEIDSLYFNGFPLGAPRTTVQYTWFDPAYGLPVMEATGQITGGNESIQSVRYLDSNATSIKSNKLIAFELFPNPVNDVVTLLVPESITYTHVSIMDITGRKLVTNSNSLAKLNVADLTKGTYIIGLFNNGKPIGFKQFIKQ